MTATAEVPQLLPEWVLKLEPAELVQIRAALPPVFHAALEERLIEMAGGPEAWDPLEHQRPPADDDWFGFLLMGGRGIGKTATITHLMDEHANGPACLRGKAPHRMGIIAPTFGDASASIVHGEDGLMVINPELKMQSIDGYRIVKWPNGSYAYIFGVHTRVDVDRLRARGNRSIRVGTPVATEHGWAPIETISPGERVWTSHGLRPVTAAQDHGIRPIWRLTTETGRELHLTADHEVWTEHGWTRADRLVAGDRVTLCSGEVTAGSGSADIGAGLAASALPTAAGATSPSCCTGPPTSTTTGRSHQATTFTTGTRIETTTTPTTSLHFHRKGTAPSTPSRRSGTLLVVERASRDAGSVGLARVAASRRGAPEPASAPSDAGESARRWTPPRCGHVSCAEALSRPTAATGTEAPTLVADRVATVSPGGYAAPVADLTVAGDHEFVAGGILVANCYDAREEIAAWRWLKDGMAQANLGLRLGVAKWVGATTPRPRPTIRSLNDDPLVRVSTAATDDNPHLAKGVRDRLYEMYENTRLGEQELKGHILDDVEGALWNQELIEENRVTPADVPRLVRVRTYVDPSWGTTNDECGIIVAALGVDRHVYILADLSKRTTPIEWGIIAALGWLPAPDAREDAQPRAFNDGAGNAYYSQMVKAETNFQAEQVRLTTTVVSMALGRRISFGEMHASRGKRVRAEPVVALDEQHRAHIVGHMPSLEFQLTSWIPPTPQDSGDQSDDGDPATEGEEASEWSPDRLDAYVFAITDLALGEGAGVGNVHVAEGRVATTTAAKGTGNPGRRSEGPKIGNIPTTTRQGRLAAEQMKGRRHQG